jgi:Ni/Co efflux regulator RcnB
MLKTLSAALIAASMLIAPMAANAAQPATAPAAKVVKTKTVKLVKTHKRHVAKHHARGKFARHARHHNKFVSHKHHGKIVKVQKRVIVNKVRTSAK